MKISQKTVDKILDTAVVKTMLVPDTMLTAAWVFVTIRGRSDYYLCYGESVCASESNFNVQDGVKYAREDALAKADKELWNLLGKHLAITGEHLVE